jgi:superfamily II DNA helicase RecQ
MLRTDELIALMENQIAHVSNAHAAAKAEKDVMEAELQRKTIDATKAVSLRLILFSTDCLKLLYLQALNSSPAPIVIDDNAMVLD